MHVLFNTLMEKILFAMDPYKILFAEIYAKVCIANNFSFFTVVADG